jgi:MtN3 and saliva related transmembrane protein
MSQFVINFIGYSAAFFGTTLMLPQVIKTYRTRRAEDISLVMLIIYIINCILWGIYGYFLQSGPMLVCNGIALIIGFLLFTMKISFRNKEIKV